MGKPIEPDILEYQVELKQAISVSSDPLLQPQLHLKIGTQDVYAKLVLDPLQGNNFLYSLHFEYALQEGDVGALSLVGIELPPGGSATLTDGSGSAADLDIGNMGNSANAYVYSALDTVAGGVVTGSGDNRLIMLDMSSLSELPNLPADALGGDRTEVAIGVPGVAGDVLSSARHVNAQNAYDGLDIKNGTTLVASVLKQGTGYIVKQGDTTFAVPAGVEDLIFALVDSTGNFVDSESVSLSLTLREFVESQRPNDIAVRGTIMSDTIDESARLIDDAVQIRSGPGSDTVTGHDGYDWIHAGGGNDTVTAGGGDDVIVFSNGADTVDAGLGNDTVRLFDDLGDLPMAQINLDTAGVLHVKRAVSSGVPGTQPTYIDSYHITRDPTTPGKYTVQQMGADGVTVTSSMQATNAERIDGFVRDGQGTTPVVLLDAFAATPTPGGGGTPTGGSGSSLVDSNADHAPDQLKISLGQSGLTLGTAGSLTLSIDGRFELDLSASKLSIDGAYLLVPLDSGALPSGYMPKLITAKTAGGLLVGTSGALAEQEWNWQVRTQVGPMGEILGVTLFDVQMVYGTDGADTYTGTSANDWYKGLGGNDTISGAAGNDHLWGNQGNDTLDGGAGNDVLHGGPGNDILIGGDGTNDVATFSGYRAQDVEVTHATDGSIVVTNLDTGEQDTLTGIEVLSFDDGGKRLSASFTPNSWNNTVIGSDFGDVIDTDALGVDASATTTRDWINAGSGDDRVDAGAGGDDIQGGAGDDILDGGNDTMAARLDPDVTNVWELENRASYSGPAKRYRIEQQTDDGTGSVTGEAGKAYYTVQDLRDGSPDGTDTVFNVDALQFSDKQVRLTPDIWMNRDWNWQTNQPGEVRGINATGTDFAESLGATDDTLATSFAGSDRLQGNAGDDTLKGGAGADTLRGDAGNDVLDGGGNRPADSTEQWDPNGSNGVDAAEYSGKAERYTITRNTDSSFTVADSKLTGGDGTDTVTSIEVLRFADGEKNLEVISSPMLQWSWDPVTGQSGTTVTGMNWRGTDWADTIDATLGESETGWRDDVDAGAGNDSIKTGKGGDFIRPGEGDDTVDGGANGTGSDTWNNNDVVQYDAPMRRFAISMAEDANGLRTFTVTDKLPVEFGGLGTDTLTNVEFLQFSEGGKDLQVRFDKAAGGGYMSQNNIQGTDFGDVIDADSLSAAAVGTGGVKLGEATSVSIGGLTLIEGHTYVAIAGTISTYQQWNFTTQQNETINSFSPLYPTTEIALTNSSGTLTGTYTAAQAGDIVFRVYDKTDNATIEPYSMPPTPYVGDSSAYSVYTVADNIQVGAGDDVVYAGAGGDHMTDGAGSDFYDGGANGTSSQSSWENQDAVHFMGAQKRYKVEVLNYSELATGDPIKARIDAKYDASTRPATIAKVTDKLPALSGGDGVNYLINVEHIQFQDGQVDLGVTTELAWSVDDWSTNSLRGGILNDTLDGDALIAASTAPRTTNKSVSIVWETGQTVPVHTLSAQDFLTVGQLNTVTLTSTSLTDPFVTLVHNGVPMVETDLPVTIAAANLGEYQLQWTGEGTPYSTSIQADVAGYTDRDWMEGGAGNDILRGGEGADQLSGGKGDDLIDGGNNPALDPTQPWNTWNKFDEARFTNSIKRYDITFYRPAATGETATHDASGLTTGTKAYVQSGYYDANGFIVVQDRYSAAQGGEGRDVVKNVETLVFSDAWEQLKPNYSDNTYTQSIWDPSANGGLGQNVDQQITSRNVWGSRFGDRIDGLADGQNYLQGNAGNDRIIGGNLRDELTGGLGDDIIDGGANPAVNPLEPWNTWDKYDVARFDAERTQFDIQKLTDSTGSVTGTAGTPYFRIEHLIPSKLGGLGTDIVYNVERLEFSGGTPEDRELQLDVRIDKRTEFVNNVSVDLATYQGTMFADNITGTSGNDNFMGNAGNDTINAGAGDDFIGAGAGNDSILAGDGNDQIVNLNTGDDTVDGGAGSDSVMYEDGLTRYTVTLRNISDSSTAATFRYDGSTLNGFYDSGNNLVTYNATQHRVVVTDQLSADYSGEGVDTLSNVEKLFFSTGGLFLANDTFSYKDSNGQDVQAPVEAGKYYEKPAEMDTGKFGINGTAEANDLPGTDGDDNIAGWAGNDTLSGGAGDDRLNGGAGNDILAGGTDSTSDRTNFWNAGDTAQYFGAPSTRFDIIDQGGGSFKIVDLASLKVLNPSSFSNGHLTAAAYDSTNIWSDVGYGVDTLSGIERLQFSDTSLDLVPLDQPFTYQSYDYATGQNYDVTRHYINGTFLDDLLQGSEFGDQFDGRGGDDIIDGGVESVTSGNVWEIQDVVRYTGSRERYEVSGVLVDKTSTGASATYTVVDSADVSGDELFGIQIRDVLPESAGGTGTDLLVNVERVEFAWSGTGDNSISIKPELNYYDDWSAPLNEDGTRPKSLNARGTIFDDAFSGTAYNDWLTGNDGNDTLIGGAGGDELEGGAGDDILIGGANSEADQWGWTRTDTARFNASFDRFTIDTVTVDGESWLRVADLLPSDDSNSLGTDLLSGVETLGFNDRWIDVAVRTNSWTDWQGNKTVNHEGTVFGDVVVGSSTTSTEGTTVTTVENRDSMRGNAGDDVLQGGGNGDELQGGEGNDVLDGGANGSSGDAWRDQDTARFNGDASRYDIQAFSVSGTSESGQVLLDSTAVATVTSGVLAFAAGLDANVQAVIERAHANLDFFDGAHNSAYLVADTLDTDLGGDGADLVFNVESLWFANGPLELDIRVDANDWDGNGKLDWVSVRGTPNADEVSLARIAELTGKTEELLTQTRIDVELREGDDVYIGGGGGESVRTGAGNDYVDGGANSGTDQWGGAMRDEVHFEGKFSRYTLIDVTLDNAGGTWSVSSAKDATLAYSGSVGASSVTSTDAGILKLNTAAMAQALDSMIAHAATGATQVKGWLVADRLPAEFEGTGVDAIVNVEAISFSDKWMPLDVQVYYQRQWDPEHPETPWEQLPITSAYVDGTQIGDIIGYSAAATGSSYNYAGDDNLRGNEGDDVISGGAGGDWIHGGAGDDSIDGGDNGVDQWGNARIDTAQYDGDYERYAITANADGSVTVADSESDGDGIDTLLNVEALSFRDRYLRLGIETWVNRDYQDPNKIYDVSVNGSLLSDTIDVSADDYPGIRHFIRGAEGDDTLTGGAGPDEFEGGAGDDTLVGGANGKDAWGNPGFDTARYDGMAERYTIEYSADDGATWSETNPGGSALLVRVTDSLSADDGGLGVDILSGIEAIGFWDRFIMLETTRNVSDLDGDGRPDSSEMKGTDSADTLTGDSTSDRLEGGGGGDTLAGGLGGDILKGGAGDDSIDGGENGVDRQGRTLIDIAEYTGASSAYTVTRNDDGSFTVTHNNSGADGTDTLTNIEGLQFSDGFLSLAEERKERDLTGDGVVDAIEIRGSDALDNSIAPDGTETGVSFRIAGGKRNDTLTGGAENDRFEGGPGNDTIDGGLGTGDRARYSGDSSAYTIATVGGVTTVTHNSGGADGTDTLTGIEQLVFADKVVWVDSQAATISTVEVDTTGNKKADTAYVTGTDSADTFTGSVDLVNIVTTGAGNDTISGGNLGDEFTPGAGDDIIDGGANTGLDAAGNPVLDRVFYDGAQSGYSVATKQHATFSLNGTVEVGDVFSVTIGSTEIRYTATGTTMDSVATGLETALATAGLTGIAMDSVVTNGVANFTVTATDVIAAIAPEVENGTHGVTGSFVVNGANQSGTSLALDAVTGLEAGMYIAYSVTTGTGTNAVTTNYGPYKISSISGTTLTLAESMGAAPADNATLTVTADNADTTGAGSDVTYDRWFEVGKSGETDTLRNVEELVFGDGVKSLTSATSEKAQWGAQGLETVLKVAGTDLPDILRATDATEIFSGGAGADHFVFVDSNGIDQIRSFTAGASGDVMTFVLGADDTDGINGSGVDTVTEMLARASQQGTDTVIDLGAGNTITLVGVAVSDLGAANFEVLPAF